MNLPPIMYRGRFALLWHQWVLASGKDDSHWDLLLELDTGKLLTWRIAVLPLLGKATSGGLASEQIAALKLGSMIYVEAIRLPDHRAIYLDYEGPIEQNRGRVTRYAAGFYQAQFIKSGLSHSAELDCLLGSVDQRESSGGPLPAEVVSHQGLRLSLDSSQLLAELIVNVKPIGATAELQIFAWRRAN